MLEALITLAILSIGLVAMAKFQGTLLQSSTLAKNRTIAINLAQNKMEILRSSDFALLSSGSDIIDASIQDNISEHYDRVWTVAGNGTNATIEVTVEWGDYTAKGEVSRNTSIRLVSNISSSSATESGRLIDP
ncbi:hypothetical protein MNBD_GAMMA18-917 [hydrothermal vent metagenome]|uniref:Type IV fimbrial biogenesis protein PilV n=1 Tax=hydrothermal vent metagenome TaxID=652676 RepID=A0A3B0ZG18_9ZZZZ